jgi:glutathione synthase
VKKRILFVGDPLKTLKLGFDSSIALAQIALDKKWETYWCEPNDVVYFNKKIAIHKPSKIESASIERLNYSDISTSWINFDEFDFCFVRKDPPFDDQYKDLCWILASQNKVSIVNSAESLLKYHEKSLHWKAFNDGVLTEENIIPTCLSNSIEVITDFCNSDIFLKAKKIVCKPWLGYGGEDVQLFEDKETLLAEIGKRISSGNSNRVLIQPCLEEIKTEGDRRIIVAGGEIICHFVRMPQSGQIISNIARGGSAVLSKMTQEQEGICKNLAKYLQKKSIYFAGIDLIGNKIGEINITSPTGIRVYEKLTGINVSEKIFHFMTSDVKS